MNTRRRSEALRWATCFTLVLGVHAAAAATLLTRWQAADEPLAGGPPILIDLAPVAAAPETPPTEATPGPLERQTASEPQVAAIAPPKEEPPVDKVAPSPPIDTPPVAETPPVIAEVVLPPPRPHETAEPKEQKQRRKLANLNSAPPKSEHAAARAVAPSPDAASRDPNAVPNWKSELVARLQRYKRYPGEAQARGEEGVAQLAFSVDRGGGVHNARIVRSSGSSLLDRATLDLISRAQPLPAPPADIRGAQIAIVVPINYSLRGAR